VPPDEHAGGGPGGRGSGQGHRSAKAVRYPGQTLAECDQPDAECAGQHRRTPDTHSVCVALFSLRKDQQAARKGDYEGRDEQQGRRMQ